MLTRLDLARASSLTSDYGPSYCRLDGLRFAQQGELMVIVHESGCMVPIIIARNLR